MTRNDDFKRRVRERMARTGESYTAARARLRPSPLPSTAANEVLGVVADYFGLDPGDVTGRDQRRPRPEARDVAAHLLVHHLGLSPAQVGVALGGRTAETVRRSLARVQDQLGHPGMSAQLAVLRDGLQPRSSAANTSMEETPAWVAEAVTGLVGERAGLANSLANLAVRLADGKPLAVPSRRLARLMQGAFSARRTAQSPGASDEDQATAERLWVEYEEALAAARAAGEEEPARVLADRSGEDVGLLAAAWTSCRETLRRNPRDIVAEAAMDLLSAAAGIVGATLTTAP